MRINLFRKTILKPTILLIAGFSLSFATQAQEPFFIGKSPNDVKGKLVVHKNFNLNRVKIHEINGLTISQAHTECFYSMIFDQLDYGPNSIRCSWKGMVIYNDAVKAQLRVTNILSKELLYKTDRAVDKRNEHNICKSFELESPNVPLVCMWKGRLLNKTDYEVAKNFIGTYSIGFGQPGRMLWNSYKNQSFYGATGYCMDATNSFFDAKPYEDAVCKWNGIVFKSHRGKGLFQAYVNRRLKISSAGVDNEVAFAKCKSLQTTSNKVLCTWKGALIYTNY